jgi:hypothetical protein
VPTTGVYYDFDDDSLDGYVQDEPTEVMLAPKSASPAQASAVERRIRARARARAGGKKVELEDRKQKAKQLKDEGQYEAAAAEYRQAIEESKELDRLEDEESVEYDFEAEALMGELREVEARRAADDGAANVENAVADVADEAGEKDLVSGWPGLWRALVRRGDAGDAAPLGAANTDVDADAGPWSSGPLVVVPEIGEVVRYQHLLLEAGERRTVPVDARRRLGQR